MKKERVLTDQQKLFIDALLNEAKGDYKVALKIAGYSENTRASDLIKTLRAEIIEASLDHLALNAPKAAHKLSNLLENPSEASATNIIKVATQILDRVGANTKDDITVKVPSGGLFIMPAKEVSTHQPTEKEDEGE